MSQKNQQEIDIETINEEYNTWKKNSPFIYDLVISEQLNWPSLTVQWLPTKEIIKDQDYALHRLILGTNTSNKATNHLIVAEIKLPEEDSKVDILDYKQAAAQTEEQKNKAKEEYKIKILKKIVHEGEVNRVRYMPQNSNLIATQTVSGEVHIFDYSKRPEIPEQKDVCVPDIRLLGHKDEGYGLSWNNNVEGQLVTGSYDSSIYLWDIKSHKQEEKSIKPLQEFLGHKAQVEDVNWHHTNQYVFGSVGDDGLIQLWDTRNKNGKPSSTIQQKKGDIYSIDFNPFNDYLFLTSCQDTTISLWDTRKISRQIHQFEGHQDAVLRAEWSPSKIGIFASASADRRCIIWDLSKCGDEIRQEDELDGPAEMMFMHGGHRGKVTDLSWNRQEQFMIASVEEVNNTLQIWQMTQNTYDDDDISNSIRQQILLEKQVENKQIAQNVKQ